MKDVTLENLEQDEVLLLGYKLILFRIVDCASRVTLELKFPNGKKSEIGDGVSSKPTVSAGIQSKYKEFFSLKDYSLDKRDIIELYSEMMTSAQLKPSPITSNPMMPTEHGSMHQYILH